MARIERQLDRRVVAALSSYLEGDEPVGWGAFVRTGPPWIMVGIPSIVVAILLGAALRSLWGFVGVCAFLASASVLGDAIGSKHFALGVSDRRVLVVRVTWPRKTPVQKAWEDDRELANLDDIIAFLEGAATYVRPSGERLRLRFDRRSVHEIATIAEQLGRVS